MRVCRLFIEENTAKAQGMLNAVGIVDKYLDKAKAINEYVKEPLIYTHF